MKLNPNHWYFSSLDGHLNFGRYIGHCRHGHIFVRSYFAIDAVLLHGVIPHDELFKHELIDLGPYHGLDTEAQVLSVLQAKLQ